MRRACILLALATWAVSAAPADNAENGFPTTGISTAKGDGARVFSDSSRILGTKVPANAPQLSLDQKSTSAADGSDKYLLRFKDTPPGESVASGKRLRILPLGDSITVGYGSESNGGDGDGYRRRLRDDLSDNKVTYVGTQHSGTMKNGNYAAWSGRTIRFISNNAYTGLAQRPNLVLLMAGTNDMNPDPAVSRQGNDPKGAAERLGKLLDKVVEKCPEAVVLVAVILGTCNADQAPQTKEFQGLIPEVVRSRWEDGKKVLAVDFGTFGVGLLRDCIHPTNEGYEIMGDYWYDFVRQVPEGWIREPVGGDEKGSAGSKTVLKLGMVLCKWKQRDLWTLLTTV